MGNYGLWNGLILESDGQIASVERFFETENMFGMGDNM